MLSSIGSGQLERWSRGLAALIFLAAGPAQAADGFAGNSYWTRWKSDSPWHAFAQVGFRGIHASTGNKLPSNIESEAQLGLWIQDALAIYAFGGKGAIRNTSTSVGAGLKIPFYSATTGGPEYFLSGLNLFAVGDIAKIDTAAGHRAGFDPDPVVVRYGLGANLGAGPWGTYVDLTGMVFHANGKLHFAPVAALGYLF
jgi:hypothetical protein